MMLGHAPLPARQVSLRLPWGLRMVGVTHDVVKAEERPLPRPFRSATREQSTALSSSTADAHGREGTAS